MQLTIAQLQTMKVWLQANAQSMTDQQAADALNQPASPAFTIYRTQVPVSEVMLNGFDWVRVDNLSIGKARIWDWMTKANPNNSFDPSKANIRAGINETWKGTQADLNVRAAVYTHCVRSATVAEKLYSTGNGTAPDVDGNGPGTAAVTGAVTPQNVVDAYNS